MKSVCVYCGSCFGTIPVYRAVTQAFGAACARRGLTIVYGGGNVGLMGTVANAALAAGGKVIGIIPRAMVAEERAHRGLTVLIVVETMHERKQQMAKLADAFVALPGGIGTLEEMVEVFTWLQLGLHSKPVGLLNAGGIYELLLQFLAQLRNQGFLTPEHHAMLTVASDVEPLLDALAGAKHVHLPKPIEYVRPVDRLQQKAELEANAASGPAPLSLSGNNALSRVMIEDLQHHLEWIPLIARWHFDAWGVLTGAQTFEGYISLLERAARGYGIPTVLVASESNTVVGSVSLVASDMTIRPSLSPWLAHLFVAPEYRRKGIGTALVQQTVARAQRLGFRRLHLYTSGDRPRYYEKLQWVTDEQVEYLGRERTVMCYNLVTEHTSAPSPELNNEHHR